MLESLLKSVLITKSGVIAATKKEFLEKNLNNKIVIFKNFYDGVKQLIDENYSFFISLQNSEIGSHYIYHCQSKS